MKSVKQILTFLFLLFWATGFTQNLSNKGKEFWVGYGHHQFMEVGQTNSQEMILYFSAEQPATVTVSIWGTSWTRTYNVGAGAVIASDLIPKAGSIDARLISVPCSFAPPGTPCGGEGQFSNKAIYITSTAPIVAYAHIYGSASSGATMLMPVDTWGYAYTSVNSKQAYATNTFSWLYVIAKENNTVIEVTPTVASRMGKPANVPYRVTLNKGDIYQTMAGPESNSAKDEMTGSRIKSVANPNGECFPVAVFSGSSRTSNTASCGSGGGDNDNQQLFPSVAWGKRYLTAPTSSSNNASTFMKNTYKIIIKDAGTLVKINGSPITVPLLANSYYTYESNSADYIEADRPIMVAQFMTGGGCLNGGVGDPEMIIISPLEQGIKNIGFYRNSREQITTNYLTLIIPTAGVPSLRIDGSNAFSHTYPHPKLSGYTVVVKRWSIGTNQGFQSTAVSDSAFTAITYGLGSVESYGYNAGTLINNLTVKSELYNVADTSSNKVIRTYTCKGTPMQMSALFAFKPTMLVWRVSQVASVSPNADVTDSNPVPKDSITIGNAKYYRFILPNTYVFSDTGTFLLPIRYSHPDVENCTKTEEVKVPFIVKPSPFINMAFSHSGCQLDTVHFAGSATGGNDHDISKWSWNFGDATTAAIKDPAKLYAVPGNYAVSLRVTTTEGCIGDSTLSITIGNKPTASIVVAPSPVCDGSVVTITDTTTSATTGTWYWDFGNGNTASPTSNAAQTVTYSAPGNYTIKHLLKTSATCVSDTVTKIILVLKQPAVGFKYPAGCLPPNGPVQFTDTSNAYGQTIQSWQWNFGDPSSGSANSSNQQNPSHTFTAAGNYDITLTVTTSNGCISQKKITATFNITPVTIASNDTTICTGTTALLTASGANNYIWTPAAGLSATTGNSITTTTSTTTKYFVTGTTNGCSSIDSVLVTVSPKPAKPNAVQLITYCQGAAAVALTATALPGHTLTWYNNPALTGSSSSAPTPSTATAGSTYYYVTQTSSTTCASDTARIEVQVVPSITNNTISASQTLCSGVAAAILTGAAPSGGTGTFIYQWQKSIDGGVTWTDISGANSTSYDPGILSTGVTNFRRTAASSLCTSTSNIINITVQTDLNNYEISAAQIICNGAVPAPLNGQTPTGGTGSYTYQWESSTNGTSWNAIPGAVAKDYQPAALTATTHFRRIATGGNCPAISMPVIITVNPLPNGSITASRTSICSPQTGTIMFTASAGTAPFQIQLSITTSGGSTSVLNKTINNNGPQSIDVLPANSTGEMYTIQLTSIMDSKGCIRTTGMNSVSITVTTQPVVTVSADTTICKGTSASLTASGATTYVWNPTSGLTPSSGASVTANSTDTTLYQVYGTTNGCTDTASVQVNVVIPPGKPLVGPQVSYCLNDSAVPLTATPSNNNKLIWYNNASLTGGTAIAPTPSTTTAGTFYYYVTQINSLGCASDTSVITVIIRPEPVANFILPAGICMPNGNATFKNTSSITDNTALSYTWNFGDASSGNISTVKDPVHTYATTGSYDIRLIVKSVYGCVKDTVKTLNSFYEKPIAKFEVNPDALCQGQDNFFTDQSDASGSTLTKWKWNFGDNKSDTTANPVHRFINSGTYMVKLIVTTAIGCVSDTFTAPVTVYLQPKIDAGPSFTVPDGTTVVFNAKANDTTGVQFLWSPATGLSSATILRPTHTVIQNQKYTLTAVGEGNCTATDTLTVRILKTVIVPNVFSPNGDGIHDTWVIPDLADYPGASVEVYNRWGQQVYISYGYNRPWDGNYSGKPLPLGTYYYIITLKNGFKPLAGSVTIIK